MTPADYDAWYDTPRGSWIGAREFALMADLLGAHSGETLLDIGCGTGWFSRRFAREAGLSVTGIDIAEAARKKHWLRGRALAGKGAAQHIRGRPSGTTGATGRGGREFDDPAIVAQLRETLGQRSA